MRGACEGVGQVPFQSPWLRRVASVQFEGVRPHLSPNTTSGKSIRVWFGTGTSMWQWTRLVLGKDLQYTIRKLHCTQHYYNTDIDIDQTHLRTTSTIHLRRQEYPMLFLNFWHKHKSAALLEKKAARSQRTDHRSFIALRLT